MFEAGSSTLQEERSSVSLQTQKFREEQLCALETLADWQQDGFKSYYSFDYSSLGEASTIHTNSASSIADRSIAAAISAKKRVLKWQEERSQILKNAGNGDTEKRLPEDHSAFFKVPLPKPLTVRLDLHEWYFGLRSRNWVLIGKIIDEKGKTKKYTSKSLLQYFERNKARKISSVDQTKMLFLSGPCGGVQANQNQLHHPNYIKDTFCHGFPKNWKEALNTWSDFILKGEPEDFEWPNLNMSLSSTSTCSHFTSVTDRVMQIPNVTRELSMNTTIVRNIGVEVDSRYALNKFLNATDVTQSCLSCIAESANSDVSNQLLNGAELSFPVITKSKETSASAALNQLPNVERSIPGFTKGPVENTLSTIHTPAIQRLKHQHFESKMNYNNLEPRISPGTSRFHHINGSQERVLSNVSNHSSTSKRPDEKTFLHPKPTSTSSLKMDNCESQNKDDSPEPRKSMGSSDLRSRSSSSRRHDEKTLKVNYRESQKNGNNSESRSLGETSKLRLNGSEEIVPSNVSNRSRSSSSKRHDEKTLKVNYRESQENDNNSESRSLEETSKLRLNGSEERVPSNVSNRSRSSSSRRHDEKTLKVDNRESQKNGNNSESRSLEETSKLRLNGSEERVPSNVSNRSRSSSSKRHDEKTLKVNYRESQKSDNNPESRSLRETSKLRLNGSEERVPSIVSNRSRSSSSKRHDEKSFPHPKPSSTKSLKMDDRESRKNDNAGPGRSMETSEQLQLNGCGEKAPSNVSNHLRSSSSSRHSEKTLPQSKSASSNSLKMDDRESRKNDNAEPGRSMETSEQLQLNGCGEKAPSNVSNHLRSSSSSRHSEKTLPQSKSASSNSLKMDDHESRRNEDHSDSGSLAGTSKLHWNGSGERVPASVSNRSRSTTRKQQCQQVLQSPKATSCSSLKGHHSEFCRQDIGREPRTPLSPTHLHLATSKMASKPNILPNSLEASNQPVGYRHNLTDTFTQQLEENNSKPENQAELLTTDNQCYHNLCGKAIDPKCSLKRCSCRFLCMRIMELKLTKIDATGSTEWETAKNMRKLVNGTEAAHNLSPATEPVVLALTNWWPIKTDVIGELLIAGDVIDSTGNIMEKNHMSSPMEVRKKGIIRTSDGNQYSLVGALSSQAKKNMPRKISASYFKNGLFPRAWKKMILDWEGTHLYASRASTRVRVQPIQYWKVRGGSGLCSSSESDSKLDENDNNKKKKERNKKKVLRTWNGMATKHDESKDPGTERCSRNCTRLADTEASLDKTERKSRKSTRNHEDMTLKPGQESNRSRSRLGHSDQSRSPSKGANSRRLERSYVEKKFLKRSNHNRFSSSKESSDSDDSGNESSVRFHTSKQKHFIKRGKYQTAVHSSRNQTTHDITHVNSTKLTPKERRLRIISSSDSDEEEDQNISQPGTAARCRPRHALAKTIRTDDNFSESDYQPLAIARNDSRKRVDVVETVADDASDVQCLGSEKVDSRPSASLITKSKVVSYPWMSDVDSVTDSDSDVENSGNTQKNRKNIDNNSSIALSSTSINMQMKVTKPVPDMKGLISGFAKISRKVVQADNKLDTNNFQPIRRLGHCNPRKDQSVNRPIASGNQYVDENSIDSCDASIVFSETDPRANRFIFSKYKL